MLYNKKHKNIIQYNDDYEDHISITKTVFEWTGVVFVLVTVAILMFSFFYRVLEISVSVTDNSKIPVTVLVSFYGYSAENGSNIIVSCENKSRSAVILAKSNQHIKTDKKNNKIIIDGKYANEKSFCPTIEEFEKSFGEEMTIPDGYVMIRYDDVYFSELDIVSSDSIAGEINTVVYPFKYLGKSLSSIKR